MDNIINEVLAHTVEFDPSTKMILHASSEFKPNASYWARETADWPHRQSVWIWMAGTVAGRLATRPLVVDWSANDLTSRDEAKWPPENAALSDLVIYKIIAGGRISSRDRNKRWPNVFNSSGHILSEHQNMGPAANQTGDDGRVHDLIYRKSYLLHGDMGRRPKEDATPKKPVTRRRHTL